MHIHKNIEIGRKELPSVHRYTTIGLYSFKQFFILNEDALLFMR